MRTRSDIRLAPVDKALRLTSIKEEWFLDYDANRLLGFGSGLEGAEAFQAEWFVRALGEDQADDDFSLVGVYNSQPLGFFAVRYRGPTTRTAHIWGFLPHHHRKFGVASTALISLLDSLFLRTHKRIFRVETDCLRINHPARNFLRRMGFFGEGYRKNACWMSNGSSLQPFDVAPFAMLRPTWTSRRAK